MEHGVQGLGWDEIETTIQNIMELKSIAKKNSRQMKRLIVEKEKSRDITESMIQKRMNHDTSVSISHLDNQTVKKLIVAYNLVNVLLLNPTHEKASFVQALKDLLPLLTANDDEEEALDLCDLDAFAENLQLNTITNTGMGSVLPKIDNSRSNDKPLSEKKKIQICTLYVEMDGGPIMNGDEEMEGDGTGGDSRAQDITDAEVSEDIREGDAYGTDADEEDPSTIGTDGDDA